MREKVLKAVYAEFHTTFENLRTQSRERSVLWPRHVAMFLLWKDAKLSTTRIGDIFGVKHTTVTNAVRTIEGSKRGRNPLPENKLAVIARVRERYAG
jgi:chromosomal replication initiator protein